jgi:hypothetical protein
MGKLLENIFKDAHAPPLPSACKGRLYLLRREKKY